MAKKGILIINLGSPDSYNYASIRKYLIEFLSDIRVIEVSRIIWIPLLYIITLIRPLSKRKDYKKIWIAKNNKSPLLFYTENLVDKLKRLNKIEDMKEKVSIDFAMRYGNPSIYSKILQLKKMNIEKITIIPFYPQYCSATTATVVDKVSEALKKLRWQPTIKYIEPWYKNKNYIDLISNKILSEIHKNSKIEYIIISYHGVPKKYIEKGDPYYCHCLITTKLLQERIAIPMISSFQSRFGPEEWVKPYTSETIKSLAKNGVKNLAVLAPGFTIDCLETREELCVENKNYFLENGGENFYYIDCLNDNDEAANFYNSLCKKHS